VKDPRDAFIRPVWTVATLLTMALAAALAWQYAMIAVFAWCGFGECSGGGTFVPVDATTAFTLVTAASVVVAAPLFGFPWTRSKLLRFGLATFVLGVTLVAGFSWLYSFS
jgi:hypothetical protein